MIYSKDKLTGLSKYMIRKIANHVMQYCYVNLGKKKNKSYPTIVLSYREEYDYMGEYNPDEHIIVIFVNNIKTVGQLTATIIHEYTHSKQNIIGEYEKLYRMLGYNDHPMEIEAYNNEKIWNRKVLNYLRKKL